MHKKRITDDFLLSLIDVWFCIWLVVVYWLVRSVGLLSFRAEVLLGSGPLWECLKWGFSWLCVIWGSDWLTYGFVNDLSHWNIILKRVLYFIPRPHKPLFTHSAWSHLSLYHIGFQLSPQILILKPQLICFLLIILRILISFIVTHIHRYLLFYPILKTRKLINKLSFTLFIFTEHFIACFIFFFLFDKFWSNFFSVP